ncbi:hypothetical protein EVAR_42455_1 [Eumeta japonica]|uniref:Uncharacterized protein n=1 Tax=Eumeta variegata TaxID=151549 RepID=A0A4C1Y0K5_EUMVA|nr:hypothetical protein EVAR_42455_1 [Eumeta japonica]
MVVRDPINKSIAKQTQEINGVLITPVATIKYLSTYLITELSRKDTIKARCKKVSHSAYAGVPNTFNKQVTIVVIAPNQRGASGEGLKHYPLELQ